jgi:hypothetical protein
MAIGHGRCVQPVGDSLPWLEQIDKATQEGKALYNDFQIPLELSPPELTQALNELSVLPFVYLPCRAPNVLSYSIQSVFGVFPELQNS